MIACTSCGEVFPAYPCPDCAASKVVRTEASVAASTAYAIASYSRCRETYAPVDEQPAMPVDATAAPAKANQEAA